MRQTTRVKTTSKNKTKQKKKTKYSEANITDVCRCAGRLIVLALDGQGVGGSDSHVKGFNRAGGWGGHGGRFATGCCRQVGRGCQGSEELFHLFEAAS